MPMKAHPYADIFPMLPDEELADLAADIKANNLLNPITTVLVGDEEMILDGRNRAIACQLAGVTPRYQRVNGTTDLLAFVVSQNVKRRQLKAGPLAIAAAEAWIEAEKAGQVSTGKGGNRTKAQSALWISDPRKYFGKLFGVGEKYVEQARALLKDDPLAAASVKTAGALLKEKYEELQLRRGGEANQQVRMRKLREQRPDLADAVSEERIKLEAAEAQARKEADEQKQQRWAFTMNLLDSVRVLDRSPDEAKGLAAQYDAAHAEGRGESINPARLLQGGQFSYGFGG
jgi:ParB-like chromosome segregation protein Spo0J